MNQAKTLCDIYKAECFSDSKGREVEIERVKRFIRKFPEKKILILNGAAGSGKTSLAYSLASELKSEILELNASDLRNSEQIKRIIGHASQQASLFGKNKILLVDEIDGINKEDYGGIEELLRIEKETKFPIIITSNNIWDRKFFSIRQKSELLELKALDYKTVFNIIKNIAEKEK